MASLSLGIRDYAEFSTVFRPLMLHSIAADGFHLHYVILSLRDLKECLYSTFHDGSVICLVTG